MDTFVAWARAHELKLRGHTMIWGEALPTWFGGLDRAAAVRAVENHIADIGRHLAGRIHSWDVVNEAIKPNDGRPDRLRRTELVEKIGPEFLDIAFRAARAADPKAKLVYNDFDFELDVPEQRDKRRTLLDLLDGFRKRGTPIDAVGLQSHLSLEDMPRFNEKAYGDFLREVAARGVEIMITELDVIDRAAPGGIAKRDAAVAATYKRFLDVALAEKAVKTVVVWGLCDRNSWIDWMNPRTKRVDAASAAFAVRRGIPAKAGLHHGCGGARRRTSAVKNRRSRHFRPR